jgi:DNA-binding CsgD family transcriptional regulator/tetratricopeptide (TPR) repeat protein
VGGKSRNIRKIGIEPAVYGDSPVSFVGREREMALLGAALVRVRNGRGGMLMLAGGPGAGKTRMALEFARRASEAGAFAAIGRCYEGDGMPAHYPWMMCVRRYVEEWGPVALAKTAGVHAVHLAQYFPEAGLPVRAVLDAPAVDAANPRYRLFEAMTAFFKRLCAERPSVIILDNLHLADPSSLAFLEFLAPELWAIPLLIVGTYRDTDIRRGLPISAVLGALAKEPAFGRVHLGGFSVPEVARLARETLGRELPPEMIRTIHERTEGNPLFVTEVIRLQAENLRTSGETVTDFPLPEGIRAAIGQRLDRLPPETVALLRTAAVIGRTFDMGVLGRVTSARGGGKILEALEGAVEARIVEEVAAGRWRFSHAMIRETLLEEQSTSRRVRLHADVATVLDALAREGSRPDCADLFHHYREASILLGTAGMVRAAIQAAREALAVEADENAFAFLDAAIEAKRQHAGGIVEMDGELAELGAWRSRTLQRMARLDEARTELRRAFEYFCRCGDRRRATELVFPGGSDILADPVYCPDLVRQALDMAEPGSIEEARLLSGYALSMSETREEARGRLDRARQIARAHGDPSLEAWITAEEVCVDWASGWDGVQDRGPRQASALADGSAGIGLAVKMLFHLFGMHLCRGRTEDAAGVMSALAGIVEGSADAAIYADQLYHCRAMLHLYRGEFSETRAVCRECLERGFHNIGLRGVLAVVDLHEGCLDRATIRWTRSLRFIAPNVAMYVMKEALQSGRADRVAEAEQAMTGMLVSPYWPRLKVHEPRIALALIACFRNDAKAAADLYPYLLPFAGTTGPGRMHAMSLDRLLGLLGFCTGDLDRAARHFEDAGAFCDRAGYRVELAWVCHDHAAALLRRNRSGDQEAAVTLLERGLALAGDIGMRPLADKIASRLQEVRAAGGRSYPDGLTRREVEVLQLVARGMTNAEIGGRLFISHHTAATHVQHILEKTGMANRAELTAYAMRGGLAE